MSSRKRPGGKTGGHSVKHVDRLNYTMLTTAITKRQPTSRMPLRLSLVLAAQASLPSATKAIRLSVASRAPCCIQCGQARMPLTPVMRSGRMIWPLRALSRLSSMASTTVSGSSTNALKRGSLTRSAMRGVRTQNGWTTLQGHQRPHQRRPAGGTVGARKDRRPLTSCALWARCTCSSARQRAPRGTRARPPWCTSSRHSGQ